MATIRERLLIFSLVAEGGYYSRAATIRGAASNRANTVVVVLQLQHYIIESERA